MMWNFAPCRRCVSCTLAGFHTGYMFRLLAIRVSGLFVAPVALLMTVALASSHTASLNTIF
jgi:hypothetical protein